MDGIPDIGPFKKRIQEIDGLMALPDFFQDQRKAASISREQIKLQKAVDIFTELEKIKSEITDHKSIIDDPSSDQEFRELAEAELPELNKNLEELHQNLLVEMIPPDSSDSRNTIVEIRAGTGGDEASLFAGDLYRMYLRFSETKGWRVEALGSSPSECGGFKEVTCLINGEDVYKTLKFESGVHRVQRVPTTETNGRVHTSTATVAVLPEAEEVDIEIDPSDLEISACKASGPGGQGVNTTDSAVQLLHKPTGLMVFCADERSQLKNKNKAMKVLRARLLQKKEDEERAKYAQNRRSQVGTGDRSERIRTYNFPQGRLSDHRIGLTLYNLPQIIEGEIDGVILSLQKADKEEKIKELLSI